MYTTQQALNDGFTQDSYGNYSYKFTDAGGNEIELSFEPLLFDNQMYVALYRNRSLLTNKVVVKPGYDRKANSAAEQSANVA